MPKVIKNKMKVQLWRDGLAAKFEGTCLGATVEAFNFLSMEQQDSALKSMLDIYEARLAKLAEKQKMSEPAKEEPCQN